MYRFQPLPTEGIRLLRIQRELRNEHIACTLNQYDGHSIPTYEALSYYWGDPKPTRKIYVNDSLVDIHESLWEFLHQMQQSHQIEDWIWTDFLCLNQKSHEEMVHQIPRMGEIYSKAKRTISWLGCNRSSWVLRLREQRSSSSLPLPDLEKDLRRIANKVADKRTAVESFFAQPELLSWIDVTKSWREQYHAFDDSGLSRPSWLAPRITFPESIKEVVQLSQGTMRQPMHNTLSLPYWKRVWIAQEVALAKEVTLIFGSISLDFNIFLLAYKSYIYYNFKLYYRPGRPDLSREVLELRVPIEARAAVHEKRVSFRQVVRWGLDCDASKRVDRIYGLLGLLAYCVDGINTIPLTLTGTIDYNRDLGEVYWDTAFTCPCSKEPKIEENDHVPGLEVIESWVDSLPTLALTLACPRTPESLRRYAHNKRVEPSMRNKAQLALSLLDICRQAIMTDRHMWINWTCPYFDDFGMSWPTKRCARRILSHHGGMRAVKTLQQTLRLEYLLGSLLLETSNSRDMDEIDKYQAIIIGLQIFKKTQRGGRWNCVSHQSGKDRIGRARGHEVAISFDCELGPGTSQQQWKLPCSWSIWPWQYFHRCRAPDRYIVIRGTGWKLSLEDPHDNFSWIGATLVVEYWIS